MKSASISIGVYDPKYAPKWKAFLEASNNGTLYHDLDFLAYHPPERFNTHHLICYDEEDIVALLPAAILTEQDGRRILASPYGGSVGGLVLPREMPTTVALKLVKTLQSYVKGAGLDGMEMRIGPDVYSAKPNDLQGFALMANGFRLTRRSLQYMLPLSKPGARIPERLFSDRRRRYVRSELRQGVNPREVDAHDLDSFYVLLHETHDRLGATPTHQDHELADIFRRVPDRARLFLCSYEGAEIAGSVIFMLNERIASAFYINSSAGNKDFNAPSVLVAHMAECFAEEGVRYLDLGPSASDSHFNSGVVFFKESLGARGFCRDTWRWETRSNT